MEDREEIQSIQTDATVQEEIDPVNAAQVTLDAFLATLTKQKEAFTTFKKGALHKDLVKLTEKLTSIEDSIQAVQQDIGRIQDGLNKSEEHETAVTNTNIDKKDESLDLNKKLQAQLKTAYRDLAEHEERVTARQLRTLEDKTVKLIIRQGENASEEEKVVEVKKSILTRIKGSKLEKVFSEREADIPEVIFIDREPDCFLSMLKFLETLEHPQIQGNDFKRRMYRYELSFWGITDELVRRSKIIKELTEGLQKPPNELDNRVSKAVLEKWTAQGPVDLFRFRPDFDLYSGEVQTEKRGEGTMFGQFKNGRMHGVGRFVKENQIQEGIFLNNNLNGWARVVYSSGNVYFGEMLNGEPHGRGETTFANGRKSRGIYLGGQLELEAE